MTQEQFNSLISNYKVIERNLKHLRKAGVEVAGLVEPYETMVYDLLKLTFDSEGIDCILWYIYDNNFGKGQLSFRFNKEEIGNDKRKFFKYLSDNHKL